MTKPTKVGQKVVRLKNIHDASDSEHGGMIGTVIKITPKKHLSGGAKALVRVLWASGSEGLHADRQLMVVAENPPAIRFVIKDSKKLQRATIYAVVKGASKKLVAKPDKDRVGLIQLIYSPHGGVISGYPVMKITWIKVEPEMQGQGIATMLYEQAAKFACSKGLYLASDETLKTGSRGFWEKQRKKGRAIKKSTGTLYGKRSYRYIIPSCPAPSLT